MKNTKNMPLILKLIENLKEHGTHRENIYQANEKNELIERLKKVEPVTICENRFNSKSSWTLNHENKSCLLDSIGFTDKDFMNLINDLEIVYKKVRSSETTTGLILCKTYEFE